MNETASKLLDSAQHLIQRRGYNAFSYKDLATEVGIRTASIHYHFPAKGDLGIALMQRYQAGLEASLLEIDRTARSAKSRLKRFIELYASTEACGAICLCGSLATDQGTLPEDLQDAVTGYLDHSATWLQGVLATGMESGEFEHAGKPADLATTLLSGLQGGLIVARASHPRSSVLAAVQRTFFASLGI